MGARVEAAEGRPQFVRLAVPAVVVSAAIVAAFLVGSARGGVTMHTAVPSSAEGAISIEADGWTYGVPMDGVAWIDTTNVWHEGGRPDCLPPTGTDRPVTFAAVQVTVKESTWRPVVWVDCR